MYDPCWGFHGANNRRNQKVSQNHWWHAPKRRGRRDNFIIGLVIHFYIHPWLKYPISMQYHCTWDLQQWYKLRFCNHLSVRGVKKINIFGLKSANYVFPVCFNLPNKFPQKTAGEIFHVSEENLILKRVINVQFRSAISFLNPGHCWSVPATFKIITQCNFWGSQVVSWETWKISPSKKFHVPCLSHNYG